MTNARTYQGFHDDKKVEEHWSKVCNVRGEKITTSLNVVPVRIMANGRGENERFS